MIKDEKIRKENPKGDGMVEGKKEGKRKSENRYFESGFG